MAGRKPYKSTTRSAAKEATKAHLIATAKAMFQARGYEATTLRDIADAAGTSTGAIFLNWSGKDALYAEAMGHLPVSPDIGAGLLSVLKGALAGSFDRERAAAIVAQFEGA